jgi:hypothetical protein
VVVASNLQSLLAASQHLADRDFNFIILSGPGYRRKEPEALPLFCCSRQGPLRVCGLHGDRRRRRQQPRGRGVGRRVHGRAESVGLNPLEHLDDNDSHTLFHKLGRAMYTGPTGTNVNDVFIALVYKT